MKKAMLGLMLAAAVTVGAAPNVAQLNKDIAQVNKEIAAATKKKLSGAAEVEKGYEKLFALLKEAGRPVPFDQAMARIQYLSEFDLKPVAELRKEADAVLGEALAHLERIKERDRESLPFRWLAKRAGLFYGADFEQYRSAAEQRAGNDVAKRLHYYAAFPDGARLMKDAALTDVVRATDAFKLLDKVDFAAKEQLLEKVLKQSGLEPGQKESALENYVRLEKSGFPRNWIGEVPKRFNGTTWPSNVDPVCYKKATDAQRELIALTPADKENEKLLAARWLELMKINYTALRTDDVRVTGAALEKALPEAKELWEVRATGYLAASAYYDEEYERAYELFHKHAVADYKGTTRASAQEWWPIAEPYVRACIAMGQYDEAYLVSTEITNGVIDSWEFWHKTQYKMKFAELAKLCKPETLEAAKAAANKK